ncbi:MAG: hypothetical protein PHD48_06725 [Alphaproteobacteria bacterium]|nr:hypothetical protein [Alphaproteobacteria bacterium]
MLKLKLFLVRLMRSIPGVQALVWKARRSWYAVRRAVLVHRPIVDGGILIETAITSATPYAAGKMGSVEASALKTFLRRSGAPSASAKPCYTAYTHLTLFVNAGVFPQEAGFYDRFCGAYLNAVKACDALVAWDVAGETEVFRHHCVQTSLIRLRDLEPYFSSAPWSRALAGKRVLVISPFTQSIENQYAQREKIWPDRDVLPAFTLLTLRAPLSAGLVPPDSKDWFEALDTLTSQMDGLDYDVALIGAGAFSLPLAVHAKARGKVGLHLGGSLQILFGVMGKRWREKESFKSFINESWHAPLPEETPENCSITEGGCYW